MSEKAQCPAWFVKGTKDGKYVAFIVAAFTERSARAQVSRRKKGTKIDEVSPIKYANAWAIDFMA